VIEKVTVPPVLGTRELPLVIVTVGTAGRVLTFISACAELILELYPLTLPLVTILK